MELCARATADFPDVPVIIITAHGTVDTAVEALKAGAFDYITKPFEQDELAKVVAKATRAHELERAERPRLSRRRATTPPLVGELAGDARRLRHRRRVADTPSTVLITGRERHRQGARRARAARAARAARQAVHQGQLRRDPEGPHRERALRLREGRVHRRRRSKPGRFELADGGTLFLDEIGEIPVEMQVKLLRALQESEFERVGGIKTIRVDVRLIAATNRDLEELIARRALPRGPLLPAQRRPDRAARRSASARGHPAARRALPREVQRAAREEGRAASRPRRWSSSSRYAWPGNIRELENVIERSVLFADEPVIRAARAAGRAPRARRAAAMPVAGDRAAGAHRRARRGAR